MSFREKIVEFAHLLRFVQTIDSSATSLQIIENHVCFGSVCMLLSDFEQQYLQFKE